MNQQIPENNGHEDQSKRRKDISSQEISESPMKVIIQSFLKRPWIASLVFFIVIAPSFVYLYNLKASYLSRATIAVPTQKAGRIQGDLNSRIFGSGDDVNFYNVVLESGTFYDGTRREIQKQYPEIPVDSINTAWIGIYHHFWGGSTDILVIEARSYDREFSKIMADVALVYLEQMINDLRRSDAKFLVEYVDKLLKDQNEQLIDTEARSREFLHSHGLNLIDENGSIDSELRELERSLTSAQSERDLAFMQIKAYTGQIDERLNDFMNERKLNSDERINYIRNRLIEVNRALADSLEKKADPEIYKLLEFEKKDLLKDLIEISYNPKINNKFNAEESRNDFAVPLKVIENELKKWMIGYDNAVTQFNYYQSAIDNFLNAHPNLPSDILEYINITRSKEVQKKTIDILVEKRETARIEMMAEVGGFRIIDEPKRGLPVSVGRNRKLLIAICLAIALGLGISYLFEYFDNTIQNESEIVNKYGLPVFGSIPVLSIDSLRKSRYGFAFGYGGDEDDDSHEQGDVPRKNENSVKKNINPTLLNFHKATSPVSEAYRSVRTSMQFIAQDRNQKIFVISSSVASEGKSLTTYNMGVSFAQKSLKTLVIDADLRRASQHKILNIERVPGLTDILLGDKTLDEAVRETDTEGLYIITAGRSVNSPAELLSSHTMEKFLEEQKSKFDIILVDTPPISPVMDSRYLANFTGGMVLIIKAESTKTPIFEHCLSLLRRLDVKILGVIMNQTNFRYGKGYYYVYQRHNPSGYYNRGYQYDLPTDTQTGSKHRQKSRQSRVASKSTKSESDRV